MIDRDFWWYPHTVSVASVFKYSNQYSITYAASKAVDGSTSSFWRTNSPTGAYIILELSDAAPVSNLQWYVGNTTYRASSFTVSGSNDGETFDDLFTGSCAATKGWQTFSWENDIAYKYIKVTCNTGNSSRLYTYELTFGTTEKTYYTRPYGKYLVAVFDGPVSDPVESDVSHFSVTAPMAVMGEDGHLTLVPTTRTVVSVAPHPDVENALLITLDTTERLDECWKPVVLGYDGSGSLTGYGRPVEAFEIEFDPQDIAYKGDQNAEEHIEIRSITASGTLIRIYYSDYQSADEHIEITRITATGTLIHVDDI